MGITGLLPFLKKASRPVNVREFSNSVAAIDVYCWMHKGAFGCAEKLVMNQPTDGYIIYVMKYIDMLLFYNIKPVLVFDGRNLPSKAGTETKRRENRKKYRDMAKDYLREGRVREARECFQRSVDITPSMARDVIQACQERGIDCIVAPYEADAQLAWLNLNNLVDVVISEDSDLTLFGCKKIIFKMDSTGSGTLYERDKLAMCLGTKADQFSFEKFRYMCIMSGCDYLPSLPGIGLGKSMKFWSRVSNPNLEQVLPRIPGYLNMHQLTVTRDYIDGFIKANHTFLYQVVFDVKNRKLRPLTDYPERDRPQDLSFAGDFVDEDLALQMALGNVDLHTLDIVHNFDPEDQPVSANGRPKYGRVASHDSIWNPDFNPEKCVKTTSEAKTVIKTAFGDFNTVVKRKADDLETDDEPKIQSEPVKRLKVAEVDGDKEVNSDEENDSPEKVFVSQYFSKKETKTATSVPPPSGSWLDELDKEQPDQLIYRPDLQSKMAKVERKSFPVLPKISELSKISLRSSPASSQEFKPVKPDKTRINPFLKKTKVSPAKSPLSEVTNNTQSTSDDTDATTTSPLALDLSQPVEDSFQFSPERLPGLREPEATPPQPSVSKYFSKKKPRAGSGLIRRKSVEKGQQSLLDMWKKS